MSSFKPFLHHVTKSAPTRGRTISLRSAPPRPRVLTVAEAQAILDGCEHLRDRFLFALLLDTGRFSGGQPAMLRLGFFALLIS